MTSEGPPEHRRCHPIAQHAGGPLRRHKSPMDGNAVSRFHWHGQAQSLPGISQTKRQGWVQDMISFQALASGAVVVIFIGQSGPAETRLCGAVPVTFQTNDNELANRACHALDQAQPQFQACGLLDKTPQNVDIAIMDWTTNMTCLGLYHCDTGQIRLISPDQFAKVLPPDSPFLAIPELQLFDSLVIHEMTHALLFMNHARPWRSFAAQEYVAYAMQLQFLQPESQAELLTSVNVKRPVRLETLSEKTLMFEPEEFAIGAWQHFETNGHGCDFVRRILNDDVNFRNLGP